jgi:hypothetical protein
MDIILDIIRRNRIPIAVAAGVLILVSFYYFVWGDPYPGMKYVYGDTTLFRTMALKAAYTPKGALKIFALPDNAALSAYRTTTGFPVVKDGVMVIGSAEAAMMVKEGIFKKRGDAVRGLFGIDVVVGGVLKRTFTLADEMHFVSAEDFEKVTGEKDRAFIAFKDEKSPKLFVTLTPKETPPFDLPLAEGSYEAYVMGEKGAKTYYPLILGADEASMMREEGLFKKPGDVIEGFFGHDMVVAGVLKPTDSILDMAHVTPFSRGDIK